MHDTKYQILFFGAGFFVSATSHNIANILALDIISIVMFSGRSESHQRRGERPDCFIVLIFAGHGVLAYQRLIGKHPTLQLYNPVNSEMFASTSIQEGDDAEKMVYQAASALQFFGGVVIYCVVIERIEHELIFLGIDD
ncbi:TPA: hypothetical protein ACSUNF_000178 [Salmonella enterica subsp. diarizonae]